MKYNFVFLYFKLQEKDKIRFILYNGLMKLQDIGTRKNGG